MAARRYAEKTSVASETTRAEIERLLTRHGATAFHYGRDDQKHLAVIAFRLKDRHIRFSLPMPDRNAKEFTHTPVQGWQRDQKAQDAAYEQAIRQRWRALFLIIKAKLEAVEAGIATAEDEFLNATLLPNGATVGEWAAEQLDAVYQSGSMPSLMPGVPPKMLGSGS